MQSVDLFDEFGHDTAHELIVEDIMVVDDYLTIELISEIENPQISGFAIYSADGGQFVEPPEPEPPVYGGPYSGGMADGEMKFLGNIMASVPSDYSEYWNQITMENAGKWEAVEPQRGNFNWGPVDTAYQYAQQNGMLFKHHVFVWGSQEPSWIQDGGNLSDAEIRAEVEEFMEVYCQRYPDTAIIDVVNEPLHAPASY